MVLVVTLFISWENDPIFISYQIGEKLLEDNIINHPINEAWLGVILHHPK